MKELPLTQEQNDLVTKNINLARKLAHIYGSKSPIPMDREEVLSLAYQGLISAAKRYRAYGEENGYDEESISSGRFFGVFAQHRIVGQIFDGFRKTDHVPKMVRRDYKKLEQAGYNQRPITLDELSEKTGFSLDQVKNLIRVVHNTPVSLTSNDDADDSDYQTYSTDLSSDHDVHQITVEASLRNSVVDAIERLPELQKVVLTLRYFEGYELQNISLETGLALTPIREAHNAALLAILKVCVDTLDVQEAA